MRGRRKDHSANLAHHIHSKGSLPNNKGDKKGAGHHAGGSNTVKAGIASASDDIKQPERKVRLEDDPTLMQLDDLITHIDSLQEPHKNQQLRFEFLLLIYLLCHMCIQNYNIYRLNFYHYNCNLLILTCIILCKRLLVRYLKSVKRDNPFALSGPQIFLNLIMLAFILLNSFYQIYQLFMRHPLKNMMFLFYPAIAYYIVFGFSGGKNQHLSEADMTMHRLKKIVYNTVECGYFAGFLPLKFLQNEYIFFDPFRCILLILFVLANAFVMFFTHLLSTSFYEIYMQAQTFGCWHSYSSTRRVLFWSKKEKIEHSHWDPKNGPYPRGTVVWHKGKEYIAVGLWNTAEPGFIKHRLIYMMFGGPERSHTFLIAVQGVIIISQLAFVFNSVHWNVYGTMLLLNYYIFYLCLCTRRGNLQYFNYFPVPRHHHGTNVANNGTTHHHHHGKVA